VIGADVLAVAIAAAEREMVVLGPQLAAPTDVLVPDARVDAVRAALLREGFSAVGPTLARMRSDSVEAIRIGPHRQLAELLEAAHNAAPAPGHLILLCAERLVADPAIDTTQVASLARQALLSDPGAWAAALKRGLDWGLWRALAHLERALAGGTVSPIDRADALRELRAAGGAAIETRAPVTIALSGVDGAGKSLQARALRDSLTRAGVPAAVEWARVAADRRLDSIARPIARVAALLHRGRVDPRAQSHADLPVHRDAARSLRSRSRLVNVVWAYVVIGLTVASQRRVSRLHERQGRSIIRDRYLIDAVVQVRDDYGVRCGRLARAALSRLAPRPLVAVLLVVSPATALERKREQYQLDDLERLSDRYREAADQLGVQVVDGEREPVVISADLFALVWQRLAQTKPTSRSRRTG
jgi:thymidylate kinase